MSPSRSPSSALSRRLPKAALAGAALAALAACAGSGAGGGSATAGPFVIAAPAAVDAGSSTTLSVRAASGALGEVTWTVLQGPGTLSQASGDHVTFVAPVGPAATTRIQVADAADPSRRGAFELSVRGVEIALSLPGEREIVASGEVAPVTVAVRNLDPAVARRLRWSLDGLPGGGLAVAADTLAATLTAPVLSRDVTVAVHVALDVAGAVAPVEATKRLTVTGVVVSVTAVAGGAANAGAPVHPTTAPSGGSVALTCGIDGLSPAVARTVAWHVAARTPGAPPGRVVAGVGPLAATFEAPIVAGDSTYAVSVEVGFDPASGAATLTASYELTVLGVWLELVGPAGGDLASVPAGEPLPLTAKVNGLAPGVGRRVRWSAAALTTGAREGQLDAAADGASAAFTPPVAAAPARYQVTAALSVDGSDVAVAPATVTVATAGVRLTLTPAGGKTQLVAGDSVLITAAWTGLGASVQPALAWDARVAEDGSSAPGALSVRSDGRAATLTATAAPRTYLVSARFTGAPDVVGSTSISAIAPDLVINEVGNAFYYDVQAWFEIFNPTSADVNLGIYTLRARGIDPVRGSSDVASTTFALPPVTMPPGRYLVVAGRVDPFQFDGPGAVRIANDAGLVPFWFGSGYLELLKGGRTVDFVRFGSSREPPTTPTAWTGGAAPALSVSDAGQYGTSIARDRSSTDRDSASDWSAIGFATPGGPNDVPPEAIDADGDGIPSSAKVPGGSFAGIDLYAMGARPGQRDVFLELDHMSSTDPGIVPQREALDRVVGAFAARGIVLHVDVGPLFSSAFAPASYNLGQAQAEVPFAACVTIRNATAGCGGDARRYKATYLEGPRAAIFHYGLLASSQAADGGVSASGLGEVNGNDFIVTLGKWGLSRDTEVATNLLVNFQAATLMHELGHNLGLRHGGGDDVNYKPNYLSVMNYMYQLYGVPGAAAADAGDRYAWYRFHAGNYCAFAHGPCGPPAEFAMDYSSGAGAVLDEASVQEGAGLGRAGAAPVDFDGNGVISATAIAYDVNGDGALSRLRDWDDWGNLALPFARNRSGQPGAVFTLSDVTSPPSRTALSPANDDDQDVAHETPPPPEFFEVLRRAR